MTRHLGLMVALMLGLSAATRDAGAQQPDACDRALRAREVPLGYRWRGDRCEGVFFQPVAGEALELRSFTRGVPSFDAQRSDSIALRWPVVASGGVRLRVRGYSLDPLYGMDAVPMPPSRQFNWATSVVGPLRYRPADLGFLAWESVTEQGTERRIYLPIEVGAVVVERAPYHLAVVGVTTLSKVTWRALPLLEGQSSIADATSDSVSGRFPPQEPVLLEVVPRGPAGTYRLEITARGTDGRVFSSPVVYFRHDRP